MAFGTSTDEVRIHYEVEGAGPPLLLHHGFSDSLWGWREAGYTDALRESYQLILMDSRGHGDSGKPHDARDYAAQPRVADVLAVLDDLGIERTAYWGYSMGGRVGYYLLQSASDRLSAAVIGGMHPYEREPSSYISRIAELRGGMATMVENREQQLGVRVPEPRRTRMLDSDADALIASTQANLDEASGLLSSKDSSILPLTDVTLVTLVYCGTEDEFHAGAERAAGELPNGEFFSLKGLNHVQGMRRSEDVLPRVSEFLASALNPN